MPHTPGPWKADKGVDGDPTRCFVTQNRKGQPAYLIAEIQHGAPGDYLETEEANAHLIAAAPAMFKVLKSMAASKECCSVCGTYPHEDRCAVLTALAQAEPLRPTEEP